MARLVCLIVLLASVAHADPFVHTDGAHFVLEGAPFVFAGANIDPLHRVRTSGQLAQTLDAVVADGLTVVRVWALGEGAEDGPAWEREQRFRVGPTGYVESTYVALDEVLAEAGKRHLKVMLTLFNAWPDIGGVKQYLAWAGLPTIGFGATDRFYDDPTVRTHVLAHLDRLVSRINTVTGRAYADDATIFAWELMNESQVATEEGATARDRFVADVSAYIRARDPHHLVTSGVVGYGTRAERKAWMHACSLPAVDFCDSHFYPQTADRVTDRTSLDQHLDDRVQLAHFVVGKPIVFGELNLDTRADHDGWLGVRRDRMLGHLLARLALDRVDGAMVWIYQPWGGKPRDFGIYVDRTDTDDVRATLRRFAAGIPARTLLPSNPRLGARSGEALQYPAYQTMRAPAVQVTRRDGLDTIVELAAQHFSAGRWERVGTWDGGALPHAYGDGDGWFEWRFQGHAATRVVLRARLSAESPGTEAPPGDGSIVVVSLDGVPVGALEAVPDDGRGAWVEVAIDDPALVRAPLHGPPPPAPRGASRSPRARPVRLRCRRGQRGAVLALCALNAAYLAAPMDPHADIFDGRSACLRCRRPTSVCWCAHLPTLPTTTRVVLLQHPRERRMAIGTARMAHLSLPGVAAPRRHRLRLRPRGDRAPRRGRRVLAVPRRRGDPAEALPRDRPLTLIVVDGTWWQAQKLVKENPRLAALPRVALSPTRLSEYQIRRQPADFCVSTIEALAETLAVLEGRSFEALRVPSARWWPRSSATSRRSGRAGTSVRAGHAPPVASASLRSSPSHGRGSCSCRATRTAGRAATSDVSLRKRWCGRRCGSPQGSAWSA